MYMYVCMQCVCKELVHVHTAVLLCARLYVVMVYAVLQCGLYIYITIEICTAHLVYSTELML